MKRVKILIISIVLLMLTSCSNSDVERHNYIFKGENDFWSAEIRVSGYTEFKTVDGTLKADSSEDRNFKLTYKKDLSDFTNLEYMEISYSSSHHGSKLVAEYKDDPPTSKTFTMNSSGSGALTGEDDIYEVTVNLDGETQTFHLVTDTFRENNPELLNELEWETASEGLEELDDVWMETEYETYAEGTTEIRVKWYNELSREAMFGNDFLLEKKVGRFWKVVSKETDVNYGFTDEGLILNSNDTRWHTYDLIPYTDGLTTGEYRISTSLFMDSMDVEDLVQNKKYHIYGYFLVKDETKKRDMTVLDNTKIEYQNENYHFSIYLPKEWEGYKIIIDEQVNDTDLDKLYKDIDKDYMVFKIRHPNWTSETPYQDISLLLFDQKQWNSNVNMATNDNYDLLPEMVSGGENKYIITIDPTSYDDIVKGYDEVINIIGTDYGSSFIRGY